MFAIIREMNAQLDRHDLIIYGENQNYTRNNCQFTRNYWNEGSLFYKRKPKWIKLDIWGELYIGI